MYLTKDKLQHISTITHEGKVVVFGTDTEGKVFYTVKQDGFEDSYLNTPADQRTGWETWQPLEFPNEVDDQSVIEQEKAELTYQNDPSRYLLRSRYSTQGMTAVAPVQAIAALDHIYVFRQSTNNTLLVDRFVLDGMANKLNRKLEVRFKRSRQKHIPTKTMAMGNNGLSNVDTLDFRDANGNFFYEPTTELCLVSNLHKGWFSVVVVPTIENDVHRWHIFAYNSQTKKVELTTLRASQEGLFDLKDYTIYEEAEGSLVPKKIPGIIQRTLDIDGVSITNGLSATKYDLQQEQETQAGDTQLLRSATKLMVAIPTDKGVAALSFAIAGDGTLSEIDETPERTIARSRQREILLPLNTLDEVKALADQTPPPLGVIRGLALGTDADDAEDLVMVSTEGEAGQLANGDLVKISGTPDIRGLYGAQKIDDRTFEIALPTPADNLGYWEKEDLEEAGLIFDGMIAAYEKTADGKLRVTCDYHGLEDGDEVQIIGTDSYDNTYPVQTVDDNHFVIERRWAKGEAVNIKVVSRKRRGIVLDGVNDYIEIADPFGKNKNFTLSAWIKPAQINTGATQAVMGNDLWKPSLWIAPDNGGLHYMAFGDPSQESVLSGTFDNFFDQAETWVHVAWVKDGNRFRFYKNGVEFAVVEDVPEKLYSDPSSNYQFGKVGQDFFSGHLAEVRIWSLPQSADTIKNNMYLQLRGKEVGLEGYWRLGGLAFGKVSDFSIHGNEGTVYGDPYVSAATLSRKLASGANAVKYSNSDLFAVSQRATYEESFEFKVNAAKPVTLADLNNADGRGQGTKIFTFSHWGKTSRSANDTIAVSAVQDEFEDLGNGWYRASCTLTIPDEISLLRSFEITNVQGNWNSLEIRKHRIRLLSDAITAAKYTDGIALTILADEQAGFIAKQKELVVKQAEENVLRKERQDLETKIAAYHAQDGTRAEIDKLKPQVASLIHKEQNLLSRLRDEEEISNLSSALNQTQQDLAAKRKELAGRETLLTGESSRSDLMLSLHQLEVVITFHEATGWLTFGGRGIISSQYKKGRQDLETKIAAYAEIDKLKPQIASLIHKEQNLLSRLSKISNLSSALNQTQQDLATTRKELAGRETLLTATADDYAEWEQRLVEVTALISAIQTEINTLNTELLATIKGIQATPQTMSAIVTDARGLATHGAILGFVQSAGRLHALETCEGNVQLSYFDTQGRMRQTNYDATADSRNAAFEQWLPDAPQACLNFNRNNSVVTLSTTLSLPAEWSLETWFVYPLPNTEEWNTLVGGDGSSHVVVRQGNRLGIYLPDAIQDQHFFDSGCNLDRLTPGWHHLTAVGKADTTLFYIDGQKVGDTKAKALADAENKLRKTPDDEAAKQAVDAIKKATVKVSRSVRVIGNAQAGDQPFGQLSEVRIWGIGLSADEIAVNSKTLLSGNEPGLLAYYPMGEADGENVRDHSGNGNNGTVSGASWWASAAPIGSLAKRVMQFDGFNDYVEVPYEPALNPSQFTISLWAKITGEEGAGRSLLTSSDADAKGGYSIQATSINKWELTVGDGNWSTIIGPDVVSNIWTHIAGTYDGNMLRLYVDGVLCGTLETAYTPNGSCALRLAAAGSGGSPVHFFPGQMAELRIWDVARTQTDIQADMHNRVSEQSPHLVAYYPLDEIKPGSTARMVPDLVGNHHGTAMEALTAHSPVLSEVPIGHLGHTVMQFDGVNDHITLPEMVISYSKGFSVEVWVCHKSFTHWSRIIDFGNGSSADNILLANSHGTNNLVLAVYKGASIQMIEVENALTLGEWTHLAATIDASGNAKVYKDGQLLRSGICHLPNSINRTRNYIGRSNWDQDGYLDAQVSDLRIWNVARTQDEIRANMYTRLSGKESNLVAYYPLGEATGSQVQDLSPNCNHGSLKGGRWHVPISVENTVMQFDGVDDYLELARPLPIFSTSFTVSMWVKIPTHKRGILLGDYGLPNTLNINFEITADGRLRFHWAGSPDLYGALKLGINEWHFISFVRDRENQKVYTYVDGVRDLEHSGAVNDKTASVAHRIGRDVRGSDHGTVFEGRMADLRIWNVARTQDDIRADMYTRLSGKEPNLVAYFPLNQIHLEGTTPIVKDLAGNYHGTLRSGVQPAADNVLSAIRENVQAIMNNQPPSNRNRGIVSQVLTAEDNTLPIGGDALVSAEYSTVTLDPTTKRKAAIMRRFLGAPTINGATLLSDKRIETLELKWIGNAQFAPTLLGYIEGPPPVPSENLTIEEDYNGATSVELTMSEDVDFSWNRAQDSGLGAAAEIFAGAATDAAAGIGLTTRVATMRAGFKGNFDFSYQFLNESNITSSSSLSLTDRLELRGTPEVKPHFPHLGTRFIPKNIGYALVVSAISDVFVTRLARSGKMVGYQVRPVEGLPPDVNTITFLMNPAYTMNGSLDGMTGSSATSDRFFKHVPEMRSQYGSLYPASYYRLKEAYDLKEQIEAEDKRRESYFSNFNARLLDEASLDRNIDSGPAPSTIGVHREEDQPSTEMTEEEKKAADAAKLQNLQANANANVDKQSQATQAKQAEIQSKITDQEKQVQATESFAGWQKRMEDLQIRAAKRNIVNTYVWDADGGLRSEQQSFANTVEHTIGGSFTMNAALGAEAKFGAMATAELTAQATVNLTQTMTKTEARSKGFELSVDLSGLEYKGITDYNDRPILPGEKVDRYRFMSFYLEGSTDHFQDFFNYVVDPEWLRSNDEEARALRQTQAGKPNKAWRVLHRVTYVERPALMGFGRDVRKLRVAAEVSENQALLDKIAKLEDKNQKLEEKLDTILGLLKEQK